MPFLASPLPHPQPCLLINSMEWGLIGGSSHEPQDSPNRQWTREHIASFSQPSQVMYLSWAVYIPNIRQAVSQPNTLLCEFFTLTFCNSLFQSEDEPKVCTCSRGDTLAVSINATVHIFDKTRNLASFQIGNN